MNTCIEHFFYGHNDREKFLKRWLKKNDIKISENCPHKPGL